MLGADTLFFTEKGFKRLDELDLYDEVLTAYGTFEPIVKLGPWKRVDRVVKLSTDEMISCDDNVLWSAHPSSTSNEGFLYTDEIDEMASFMSIKKLEIEQPHMIYNPYDFAVVVPTCIPDAYLLSSNDKKLELFAGLVDSPICEMKQDDARYYKFYTRYPKLERDIVKLARIMGWDVSCKHQGNLGIITVYVDELYKELPVKDEYKIMTSCFDMTHRMKIIDVGTISDDANIYGREVIVNGGMPLIGYSLVPVN